jgi:hypothetical protein
MRKPVIGWEGYYEVDEGGDVFSMPRVTHRSDGTIQTWGERPMRSHIGNSGYLLVRLSRPGKRVMARIHRLVAEAFIPNPENKPEVNHKNGERWDPRVENLEWVTSSENHIHAVRVLGTVHVPHHRGSAAPIAKMTESIVSDCRKAAAAGASIKGLARRHSVNAKTMRSAILGETWTHVPLPHPPEASTASGV